MFPFKIVSIVVLCILTLTEATKGTGSTLLNSELGFFPCLKNGVKKLSLLRVPFSLTDVTCVFLLGQQGCPSQYHIDSHRCKTSLEVSSLPDDCTKKFVYPENTGEIFLLRSKVQKSSLLQITDQRYMLYIWILTITIGYLGVGLPNRPYDPSLGP